MLKIVEHPDERLCHVCAPVELVDASIVGLIDDMAEAMYASGGVGLAAPQVGSSSRIALIDPTGGEESGHLVVMINPEVTWVSGEAATAAEGCLSLPGVSVRVRRPVAVEVVYSLPTMERVSRRFTGIEARIVQHEVDHLDGLTVLDRVGSLERRLALKDRR